MTRDEAKALLTQYKHYGRKAKALKLKYQELERELQEAQAGFSPSEKISGGSHKSREEKFAELMDIKDTYYRMLNKCERACRRTIALIENIYTNNENVDPSKSNSLELYEEVLIYFYCNEMKIIDIMLQLNYSRTQIYRFLQEGINEFYKIVQEFDYEIVRDAILEEDFNTKVKYGTLWDKIIC